MTGGNIEQISGHTHLPGVNSGECPDFPGGARDGNIVADEQLIPACRVEGVFVQSHSHRAGGPGNVYGMQLFRRLCPKKRKGRQNKKEKAFHVSGLLVFYFVRTRSGNSPGFLYDCPIPGAISSQPILRRPSLMFKIRLKRHADPANSLKGLIEYAGNAIS